MVNRVRNIEPEMSQQKSDSSQALISARRVLELEATAIHTLSQELDDSFTKAIEILMAVTGRVIITGMGKSGHIARKIAASLASTGTPASFVHPGEASHGDLGMITRNDAVLAMSNSGNTAELGDLITYTRRYGIPLIAMTGRKVSALAEAADVALILPNLPEACPHGLAPTTSTTMSLALGDALAVALLEQKDFKAQDFKVFHPGGALGTKLLKVSDLMHGEDLPLCSGDTRMSETILIMTQKAFGCIGVTDAAGLLKGIVTDGDLRRHMDSDILAMTAEDVMTASPKTTRPAALAAEALGQMNESSITSLFVTDNQRPVGIIHIHDCLRAGIA
ncbi:KpsF/GutQ family sugar-phosphate isomerase [Kiloniella laminariae]|uniref:KpsF/GutQ family sugar-phosphate isomerase n=1 Tax=Kiloniella laminariae TaxID=454162 RepID=UPI00036DD0F3|nr:KpsF/GutQ family sugar-phosphate isomerase [Kiloniella laminariae]